MSVLLVLILALLTAGGAAPPARAGDWCGKADYLVLGARGSGQQHSAEWGWYADTVGRAVDAFKQELASRHALMGQAAPVVKDVPLSDAQYPAWGTTADFVRAALKLPGDYAQSVNQAKSAANILFDKVLQDCPAKTKVLLVGYSQGAQIMADIYQAFLATHPDRIAGGIFFGDPYFRGDSYAGSSGRWPERYDPGRHGGLGQRPEFAQTSQGRVISTCHPDDVVCQGIPDWVNLCAVPHPALIALCAKKSIDSRAHNYTRPIAWSPNPGEQGDNPYDLTAEAVYSARRVVSGLGLPRPSVPRFTGPQDVVLVFDSTVSMDNDIQDATTTIQRELIGNPDFALARFALVEYKGDYDYPVTRTVVNLTSDRSALLAGLKSLKLNGCCTEQVLAGTSLGLDQVFRPEVRKSLILFGDEPGADLDPQGLTTASVAQKARELGVRIMAINYQQIPNNKTFAALTRWTGGYLDNVYGAQAGVGPAAAQSALQADEGAADESDSPLMRALTRLDEYPTVEVAVSPLTFTGLPVVFSAAPSNDPVGYLKRTDWDFDNDGTFEVSGTASVTRVFDTPGTRTIGVRVTNDAGLTSVKTLDVIVYERPAEVPDERPAAPPAPRVKALHKALRVTVRPPTSGAASSIYRVIDTSTDQTFAVIQADIAGKPLTSVTLRRMDPKHTYKFAVQPENIVGFGPIGEVTSRRPLPRQRIAVQKAGRRLRVTVAPTLPNHWRLALERRTGAGWVAVSGGYQTGGPAERVSITVGEPGLYRVVVARQRGYREAHSKPVRIS